MHDLIDELGEPAEAASRMFKRGTQPMIIAIEILGGQAGLARVLGISPQAVSKLLLKDIGRWPSGYLEAIENHTKIPMKTLMLDKTPLRGGKGDAER